MNKVVISFLASHVMLIMTLVQAKVSKFHWICHSEGELKLVEGPNTCISLKIYNIQILHWVRVRVQLKFDQYFWTVWPSDPVLSPRTWERIN